MLVDNVFDVLMAGKGAVERWPVRADVFERELPVAEHGFAALLEVAAGGRRTTLLFDSGVSKTGVLHNLDALGVSVATSRRSFSATATPTTPTAWRES